MLKTHFTGEIGVAPLQAMRVDTFRKRIACAFSIALT